MVRIAQGRKVQGTNPETGRSKYARGMGQIVRTEQRGYHGLVTVVRWSNGVESYHCADLDNSNVEGLA